MRAEPTSPPEAVVQAEQGRQAPATGTHREKLYFNRELSWLDFNRRVLELAKDATIPLLERVKFLAIFASNLDEFFMKRIGGLHRQREDHVAERSLDGLTVAEQLELIHATIRPMLKEQIDLWFGTLHPALKKEHIQIKRYGDLTKQQKEYANDFFAKHVFNILTPLAVDPGHPFPFISNLSKSMGVFVDVPGKRGQPDRRSFVRVKVPENLQRWLKVPCAASANCAVAAVFVPMESVISANLRMLFPGVKVVEDHLFRVTRNADVEMDEEDADDLLSMVTQELRLRRMADVVRLELPDAMSKEMRQVISDGLEVKAEDVYVLDGPIDMDDLMQLSAIDRPDLKFPAWTPRVPRAIRDEDAGIFQLIRSRDILVHHPYESFAATVEKFIETAAADPKVLAIKMTLYRTSMDSPFVPALIRAAEAGKQVAVLVEIKARFDEHRNVELARRLEASGVHVVYGIVGLKTHTKLAAVVREENDGLRTFCHIGTGNYNSRTAQLYTDLGLFTADPSITQDVIELFHYLTGRSEKKDYRKLLVAPVNMRDRLIRMIDREIDHAKAGRPSRIIAKMNALQDKTLIRKLYDASNAGVPITLFVRGFCTLVPGVPGQSQNIEVISILGRFLEHSRIYYFLDGGLESYYIGSADWMVRNLDYRVEAITPVEEPALRRTIKTVLDVMQQDYGHAWMLRSDGTSTRRVCPADREPIDTQVQLMSMYAHETR